MRTSLRGRRAAAEARWTEDDEREQHDESDRLAPLRVEPPIGKVLGQAEQHPTGGRATHAADASDDGGGEAYQHHMRADRRVEASGHGGEDRAWHDHRTADRESPLGNASRDRKSV